MLCFSLFYSIINFISLGFALLDRQNKTIEDVTLSCMKLCWLDDLWTKLFIGETRNLIIHQSKWLLLVAAHNQPRSSTHTVLTFLPSYVTDREWEEDYVDRWIFNLTVEIHKCTFFLTKWSCVLTNYFNISFLWSRFTKHYHCLIIISTIWFMGVVCSPVTEYFGVYAFLFLDVEENNSWTQNVMKLHKTSLAQRKHSCF